MAINLTLNDFRGVLGIKNDGDVAMKLDRSGIEKVNWGGFFRNLFFKVRKVPSNPVENAQIRQALLMAIGNSSEGKVLTEEQMQQIYSAIGMPVGADAAGNSARLEAPLTRRELKNIIDIIDSAIEGDKLVDKAIESLKEMSVLDGGVAGGVKAAMKNAPFANPPAKSAERVAAAREFFGNDFKGRTPVEMEKFVRLNMAVIREQVFDRLYWSNKTLRDFTAEADLDDAQLGVEDNEMAVDEADFVKIGAAEVSKVFKEVVGSLMEKFAAGTRITTRVETLAPPQEEFVIANKQAEDVWNKVVGKDIENCVNDVFMTTAAESNSFTAVQLKNASQAVVNMLRKGFCDLFVASKSNTQSAQTAFDEKYKSLDTMLKDIAADMMALGPDAAGKFRIRVADELAKTVPCKDPENSGAWLADAALKALDNASKNVLMHRIVEDCVDRKFPYLQDRKPVVDFFVEKMSKAENEGGITTVQCKCLLDYQLAVLDNGTANDVVANDLNNLLITPLATAYNEYAAQHDLQQVRANRATRNTAAFEALVKIQPGYDKMNPDEKEDAFIKLKLATLIAKVGYDKVFELGISSAAGSESVKKNPATDFYDDNAIIKLDDMLLEMDDREFEFYSQYSAKGMRKVDNDIVENARMHLNEEKGHVFQDALRDGTISISSIPAEAVQMLNGFIEAQIYDTSLMNEDGDYRVSIRELLPKDMQTSPLSTALLKRFNERIVASGIKPIPAVLAAPTEGEGDQKIAKRLQESALTGFGRVRGFGTMDLGRILKLIGEMGIDLRPLAGNDIKAKTDVYEKVFCLSMLAEMSGYKLDSLAEFTERVVGKPFDKVNYADILKALNKAKCVGDGFLYRQLTVPDPISSLKGSQKTVKELFGGEMALANAKLTADEAAALLATARDLAATAPGVVKSASVAIKGVNVSMTRLAGGELSVRVDKMPMRAAFDAHGLVRMLENEITSNPNSFDAQVVKSTLPSIEAVRSGKVPLVRARELYAKTAAAKTGLLPVMFSSYPTDRLREIAIRAVDGTFTANNMPKVQSTNYNSGAMLEMQDNLSHTSAREVYAKVKIAAPPTIPMDRRRALAPDQKTVSNLIADFFLNQDTWAFDAGNATGDMKGERVRKLIEENEPELSFIIEQLADENQKENPSLLSHLPAEVRTAMKAIFDTIKDTGIEKLKSAADAGIREKLAEIESAIDTIANTIVDAMQEKVTTLFKPKAKADAAKADWQKTFSELTGKEGLDADTKQGKFTLNVLDNYFKNSAGVDKRAMLSAFIRNTDDKSSDAKQVAELLKGAGPLLQKMLQGLPLSSFNIDTQLALKDMKSRLLPIPDEAVKAQMLELVNSSNGNILSIEVKQSLGAATVGQAFLCTIKTKTHPFIGEECVIKLLRPNVDTMIQREKALIDELIKNDPAMKETFNGQYRKILEEFDLTREATNVGIGTKIYEMPDGVKTLHSMEMLEGTTSTMTSMVVKKAQGATFDAVIENARTDADAILMDITFRSEVAGGIKTVFKAQSVPEMSIARRKLLAKAAQLNERRNQILEVTKAWFKNALFGNGFFHGDLHGGNLMTGTIGTTFIDFGNCSHLKPNEQKTIAIMLASTVSGDADHVVNNFKKLLPQAVVATFDAKFPAGSQEMKALMDILKRGNAYDLMPRLQAFISVVQGADVPIPASLQNFVQSYMRLSDIVADIDRKVEDLKIDAAAIYCDSPDLEPVVGESPILENLKKIARAYVGNADTPYSGDAVRQATADAKAYAATEAGKAEIKALIRDEDGNLSFAKAFETLQPFCEKMYNATKCFEQADLEPTLDRMTPLQPIGSMKAEFEKMRRLEDEGNLTQETAKPHLEELERLLGQLYNSTVEYFITGMSLERHGESTFEKTTIKVDKSMTDICCEVIGNNSATLAGLAQDEYGGIAGALMFRSRLNSQMDEAEAAATRRKNLDSELAKENDKRAADKRLPGRDLATLLRATNTFFTPTPRPDADAAWGKTPERRRSLLDVISYNLRLGADALEVPHLGAEAAKSAARNFGLADKKLAESIIALSNADYDALLAQAQQLDAERGEGVVELASAVEALRGSGDLLAKVSEE